MFARRIGVKWNVRRGNAEVGLLCIEHRKVVVVLGREYYAFHTRIPADAAPQAEMQLRAVPTHKSFTCVRHNFQ